MTIGEFIGQLTTELQHDLHGFEIKKATEVPLLDLVAGGRANSRGGTSVAMCQLHYNDDDHMSSVTRVIFGYRCENLSDGAHDHGIALTTTAAQRNRTQPAATPGQLV